jgi:hypothetical protein
MGLRHIVAYILHQKSALEIITEAVSERFRLLMS